MEFTINSIGNHSFLTYEIIEEADLDNFSLNMMRNNTIEGILPFSLLQMDQEKQIRYDVTGKVSLEQFKNAQLKKDKALNLLRTIAEAFLNAEQYMLEPEGFLLENRYIYVNYKDGTANLIYFPGKVSQNLDVLSFIKNLVMSLQYDPNEDIRFVTLILNKYNSGSINDIPSLIAMLKEFAGKKEVVYKQIKKNDSEVKKKEEPVSKMKPEIEIVPSEPALKVKKKPFSLFDKKTSDKNKSKDKSKDKSKEKYGEKTKPQFGFEIPGGEQSLEAKETPMVLPTSLPQTPCQNGNKVMEQRVEIFVPQNVPELIDDDATVLIHNFSGKKQVSLKRIANGQVMQIHKQEFRLGKDSSTADFYIGNNATISKNHATIFCQDDIYYLVDNESTNHTYVNGEMLIPNLKKKLENGTKIILSNEEFEFSIK